MFSVAFLLGKQANNHFFPEGKGRHSKKAVANWRLKFSVNFADWKVLNTNEFAMDSKTSSSFNPPQWEPLDM